MSQPGDPGSIFPLLLTPFEAMMVRDDRPDYPMTCAAEFTFSGSVNRQALESALRQTARRHPLCSALVRQHRDGRLYWVPSDRLPAIMWLANGQQDDFVANRSIDLFEDVGARISIVWGAEETRLRFTFHHACCDAAGGMAFVEDLLVFYALACGAHPQLKPRPLQLSALAQRCQLESGLTAWRSRLASAAAAAGQLFQVTRHRALPLAAARPRASGAGSGWQGCRYVVRQYDETRIRDLRHQAARQETALNDLLLKDLLCTLHAWQVRQNDVESRRELRVVVPVNLRDRADAQLPACNKIGYAFLSTRMDDVHDEQRLLQRVRRKMALCRRHRLPHWFVRVISMMHHMPLGVFRRVFSDKSCHATAVFTNLGDPTRRFAARFPRDRGRLVVGNLVLESMTSIAPIRPNTRAVFSMNTYANQLTMTARFDPAHFSLRDAELLLQEFAERSLPTTERHTTPRERNVIVAK